MLLAHLVVSLRFQETFLINRRQLWPIQPEREFGELAGEFERHLIVLVVHRCAGVEGFVPLHDERDRGIALWDACQRFCAGEHGSARRDVWPRRYETSCDGSVEWQHVVLVRLLQEQLLQIFQLLRISCGNVVALRPVLAQVVKFPRHFIEGILVNWPDDLPRRSDHLRTGDPAVVIDGVAPIISTGTWTPLNMATSLGVPINWPSALEPLSPLM